MHPLDEELFLAAEAGCGTRVRLALSLADPRSQASDPPAGPPPLGALAIRADGQTPLIAAATAGSVEAVALLAPLSDLGRRNRHGFDALGAAAHAGHARCVRPLVAAGGSVEARVIPSVERSSPVDGWTPLMLAAAKGRDECVGELLALGADPRAGVGARLHARLHPLWLAAGRGNAQCAALLLAAGADPDVRGGELRRTPLMIAVETGAGACVDLLLPASNLEARDAIGSSAADLARLRGDARVAEALAQAAPRAKSAAGDPHPLDAGLFLAASRGDATLVAQALDDIAVLRRAHEAACARSWLGRALGALRAGGPQGVAGRRFPHGQTPLIAAAKAGSAECVALLASLGDPRRRDHFGLDALAAAIRANHPRCVAPLAAAGCDLDAPVIPSGGYRSEIIEWTPAMIAAQGRPLCLRALAAAGANLEAGPRHNDGGRRSNPLLLAARHGFADCVAELLAAKASPFTVDAWGQTPLMLAAESGHLSCVELLAPVSEIQARSNAGHRAIPLARANGHHHVVELLLRPDPHLAPDPHPAPAGAPALAPLDAPLEELAASEPAEFFPECIPIAMGDLRLAHEMARMQTHTHTHMQAEIEIARLLGTPLDLDGVPQLLPLTRHRARDARAALASQAPRARPRRADGKSST